MVAIDQFDYVYVVDATCDGPRWCVHLVVSLGDDIVFDDATHDRAKVDCDPSSFWASYVAHVATYRPNL